MLDLKGLCEMLVIDASEEGATAEEILAEIKNALIPLRRKEQARHIEELAKELTLKHVEETLGGAMSDDWNDTDLCDLDEAMKIRFPRKKHHELIEKIWQWSGDVSNEREEMGKYGPSREFERGYDKVMRAIKRLPWKK